MSDPAEPEQKHRILVVDDEASNLQVVGAILREQGSYRISLAMNGEDALRQARTSPPDLILLDVMMPGISGYDVCRTLKQDPELKKVPVIFLSAKAGVEDYIEGFEVGGTDYVSKPFVAEILLARIATHLKLFVHQRELEQFHRYREEQRRAERHAAYQNGLTEMGAAVLHTMGNVITSTDSSLFELEQFKRDFGKVGESVGYAQQLLSEKTELGRAEKLLEVSAQWMNSSGKTSFEQLLEKLQDNMGHIRAVLGAQRRLTQNSLISTEFPISSLIADVELLLSEELVTQNIELVVDDQSRGLSVNLPRSPLWSLCNNLVTNSLEAIARHVDSGAMVSGEGCITVHVSADADHHWTVEITDNGDGIDQELLQRVINSGVTTKIGGAGLGLHSAANFINSVGGTLEVDSEGQGQGAIVRAHFPC